MITRKFTLTLWFVLAIAIANGQHLALTFQEAEKQGKGHSQLDSIYKSAMHTDTSQAVFKSAAGQQAMTEAYVQLLRDFGKFLSANNFKWERPTRCFNRIYFNADGSIDYFLYNFLSQGVKTEDQLSPQKQTEFNRLLNAFIQDYKIPLTAQSKFAQCSPVTYMPKE